MTDGAIDNDFDDAEKPPAEQLAASFKNTTGDEYCKWKQEQSDEYGEYLAERRRLLERLANA